MEQRKEDIFLQQMPHDDEAENNILGTIMRHDELFMEYEDILRSDLFYSKRNQAMYRIVKYLVQHGQVIDQSSVVACAEKFRNKIGVSVEDIRFAVIELGSYDNVRTLGQDVERIIDYGIRRITWETLQRKAAQVITLTDNTDDTIESTINSLGEIRGSVSPDDGIISSSKAIKMVYDQIDENLQGFNKSAVKTGFRFTDSKGGIRLGSEVIIGAWTSVGKSSIALNMALNMAVSGVPVAYYSFEMGAVELWSRIVSSYTNISAGKILNYPLRRDEVADVDKNIGRLMNIPLYIDDKATTRFSKMIRSVRTMVKKYGIKVFFVDYLQIFIQNSKGSSEESSLGYMAREIKNVCRELNIIGVALSQLRRDKEERHPTIDMLRGSGQLEESADIVVLIDRPEAHPEWGVQSFYGNKSESTDGKAELRVCKGRNIGLGTYYVGFDAQRTTFYELDGYTIGDEIGYDGDVSVDNTPISRSAEEDERKDGMPF